jgi:hypothetical protein
MQKPHRCCWNGPFPQPVQGGGEPNQGEFFPIEKFSLTSTQIIEDDDDTYVENKFCVSCDLCLM